MEVKSPDFGFGHRLLNVDLADVFEHPGNPMTDLGSFLIRANFMVLYRD